jgi:hypothetical protein
VAEKERVAVTQGEASCDSSLGSARRHTFTVTAAHQIAEQRCGSVSHRKTGPGETQWAKVAAAAAATVTMGKI